MAENKDQQKKKMTGLGRGLQSLLGAPADNAEPAEAPTTASESKTTANVSRETTNGRAAGRKTTTTKSAAAKTASTNTASAKTSSTKAGSVKDTAHKTAASKAPETDGTPKAQGKAAEKTSAPSTQRRSSSKGTKKLSMDSLNTASRKGQRPSDMFFEETAQKTDKRSMSDMMSERTSSLRAPRRDHLVDTTPPENVSRETSAAVDTQTTSGTVSDESRQQLEEIAVASIVPNRKQPRKVFDEDDLNELTASIQAVGILQPIVVRPMSDGTSAEYELIMGERRWRASQAAGLEMIPAIIRSTADVDLLRDALLENIHRSQLNPLEEAAAYQDLLNDYGCTQDELSKRIGRSRSRIANTLRLMNLPPLIQRRLASGVLSAGHARALLALPDAAAMETIAQRIVREGLSVRAVEELVASFEAPRIVSRETQRREPVRHERLDYLANSLSDRLDTTVKINLGAKKGKVLIEFATVDDLNRIMDLIAPQTAEGKES